MSWWWVAFYAVVAVGLGAAVIWWLWPPVLESPAEATKARAEAVRTGLIAAGGAGAVFTLWLAVRRQRSTEEMDAATRHDAKQRQVTELYTAAAQQLGHDRAAVRLAGLYSLQRLGQDHPEQRRPIVNVWCAYLRMPFRDPDDQDVGEEELPELRQEAEVRVTVQRLLREHVHSGPHEHEPASSRYWGDDLDVDLAGATLYKLDLAKGRIHPNTTFARAHFTGPTSFFDATFRGRISFFDATFDGSAVFGEVTFCGDASFDRATFHRSAVFGEVTFCGDASFDRATFQSVTLFLRPTFEGHTSFDGVGAWCVDENIWPKGWTLQPVESDMRLSSDPSLAWGQLVRTSNTESGPEKSAEDESGK